MKRQLADKAADGVRQLDFTASSLVGPVNDIEYVGMKDVSADEGAS